ncbi:DgyrCDS14715 [Dimorphilus gyrociliatus]|uniref:DgyrCDS14715 n=1 Tax=Dimorphilus gyrociliatus TaxID=2664684 RepID=A0A7I8WEM0_9ANNE|nr:DgyrCDS14715 [Dimorphilus gyrociliatus]
MKERTMNFLICLTVVFCQFEYSALTSPPRFIFDNGVEFNEGDEVEIKIKGGFPGHTCSIQVDPDYSGTGATSFSNLGSSQTVTLTLSIVSDGETEGLEEKILRYNCPSSYYKSFTSTISILSQGGGGGDPHFLFYGVYIQDQKYQDWHSTKKPIQIGDFTVTLAPENNIFVVGIKKQNHSKSEFFSVKKSKKLVVGEFLDIIIQTQLANKKNGGLLGIVYQKNFHFFKNVQDSENNMASSVIVNDRLVHSKIVKRYNNDCWLLDVNDILFPENLNNYLE